jgi:hypothetical protein
MYKCVTTQVDSSLTDLYTIFLSVLLGFVYLRPSHQLEVF